MAAVSKFVITWPCKMCGKLRFLNEKWKFATHLGVLVCCNTKCHGPWDHASFLTIKHAFKIEWDNLPICKNYEVAFFICPCWIIEGIVEWISWE